MGIGGGRLNGNLVVCIAGGREVGLLDGEVDGLSDWMGWGSGGEGEESGLEMIREICRQ